MEDPSQAPPRMNQWRVVVTVSEEGDRTHARAALYGDAPTPLEATGESVRGRFDPVVPEIGDEVAVARALRRLADRLLETAAVDIEELTGEHDVSLRPL